MMRRALGPSLRRCTGEGKPMRCKQVDEPASAYVDGRLAPRVALQVEAHLQQCSPCRALIGDSGR